MDAISVTPICVVVIWLRLFVPYSLRLLFYLNKLLQFISVNLINHIKAPRRCCVHLFFSLPPWTRGKFLFDVIKCWMDRPVDAAVPLSLSPPPPSLCHSLSFSTSLAGFMVSLKRLFFFRLMLLHRHLTLSECYFWLITSLRVNEHMRVWGSARKKGDETEKNDYTDCVTAVHVVDKRETRYQTRKTF